MKNDVATTQDEGVCIEGTCIVDEESMNIGEAYAMQAEGACAAETGIAGACAAETYIAGAETQTCVTVVYGAEGINAGGFGADDRSTEDLAGDSGADDRSTEDHAAEDHGAGNERLWTLPYITLISLGIFISMSFYMVMPLLSKYALQRGASVPAAGVIVGMFSITALFARPVSGIISDRLNKKYVFMAATALIGLSLIGYGISAGIASLVVFRFIHAVAFSVNGTVNLALVAQTVPRKRMGEGIGYFGLGHIIATAAGPAVGLYIGERFGLSAVFLAAGAIMLAVSAAMSMLPHAGQKANAAREGHKGLGKERKWLHEGQKEPNTVPERPCSEVRGNPKSGIRITDFIAVQVLPLAFFGSVFSMFNGVIGAYLVLLGEERGIENISLYFTVNAIALVLVRIAAGKIYDRYGISAILIPAFILAAVAAVFIGFAGALPMILAAAAIKAFAQGSAQPSIQAECIRMLPDGKSGVATSTYYIGADIGQGFGPMLAGAIAAAWNYGVMFTVCAGFFLAVLLVYFASMHVRGFARKKHA